MITIASPGIDFDTVEDVEYAFRLMIDGRVPIRPLGKLDWDAMGTDAVIRLAYVGIF